MAAPDGTPSRERVRALERLRRRNPVGGETEDRPAAIRPVRFRGAHGLPLELRCAPPPSRLHGHVLVALDRGREPVGIALIVIPVLLLLTMPLFNRATRNERFDLGGLLATGLLLRFALSYYRFDHAVDSRAYHHVGVRLAESFRQLNFGVDTGAQIPGDRDGAVLLWARARGHQLE